MKSLKNIFAVLALVGSTGAFVSAANAATPPKISVSTFAYPLTVSTDGVQIFFGNYMAVPVHVTYIAYTAAGPMPRAIDLGAYPFGSGIDFPGPLVFEVQVTSVTPF